MPDEAAELLDGRVAVLLRIPLASLLIELTNAPVSPTCRSTSPASRRAPSELKRNLIACLVAFATNMGLTAMSEASSISYDVLAWTAEWYPRDDTLRAATPWSWTTTTRCR